MSKTKIPEASVGHPTSEAPEPGIIEVKIGKHLVPISSINHWMEDDGLHVFRSTEFDCMAEADDEGAAVKAFIENAEDLFRFLDDLVDAGRATEGEKMTLIKLSRRFFEVYEALELEREAQRNSGLRNLLRQPPRSQPQWQPQQAPADFSQLSPVARRLSRCWTPGPRKIFAITSRS